MIEIQKSKNLNRFNSIRFIIYSILIYYLVLLNYDLAKTNAKTNVLLKHIINPNDNSQISNSQNKDVSLAYINDSSLSSYKNIINFEGFNNETGVNESIIPNIIHYVNLNQPEMKFPLFLNILSAWLNQKPDIIYLHCDVCSYSGKYWNSLNSIPQLKSILRINKIENFKKKIFNQNPGWIHHKSDIYRIMVLMNYGGIYLDNDMIVVNSLDKYRKFETVVSWDSDKDGIGNQIIIAHRNSRLMRAMFDGYRHSYDPGQWYYNGGFYPAKILLNHRYLAHSVKYYLGTQMLIGNLFHSYWSDWRKIDTIHLLINHRSYLDKLSPIKEFDEKNILNYNFTFGEIARDLINRSKVVIT